MGKFNFNIDNIEDNETSLSKSKYNSKSQKELLELYDYVIDLGLPSGTLWCKYNLGCNFDLLNNHQELSNSENWCGDYYAWGEVKSRMTDFIRNSCSPSATFLNYKYAIHYYNHTNSIIEYGLTKYCDNPGYGYNKYSDNLTLLLSEDDAAYQNMHYKNYKFCIPSEKQFEELLKYTTKKPIRIEKKKDNGLLIIKLNGLELTSKINGYKIFFPSVRRFDDTSYSILGAGYYWTSNTSEINPNYAKSFKIINNGIAEIETCNRYYVMNIRPVINL